jgi:agmatine deiminase
LLKSFDDIVYLTEALARRYPEVYWPVRINCEAHGVRVITVNNTRNIWLRDFFPQQINGELIRFQYGRKWDAWKVLDISNEPWTGLFEKPIRENHLVIDGGNIVQDGQGKAILTDKVIDVNGREVIAKLEKLFKTVIIIPAEPGDTLGHSDGIVAFVDSNTVLINDYAKQGQEYIEYEKTLRKILASYGIKVEFMPYVYGESPFELTEEQFRKLDSDFDEYNPAWGYYLNFLRVQGVIFLPVFKIKKDAEAMSTLKRLYPHHSIIAVDCSKLSWGGGLLHCISASYKGDRK